MEASLFGTKTHHHHHLCSKITHLRPLVCESGGRNLKLPKSGKKSSGRLNGGLAVGCGSGSGSGSRGPGSVAEKIERELEAEMKPEKEEWVAMGWLRQNKCGDRKGVVELLECLELEAIMGEDEGREPNDYNRRAQIFDKSARVFQALKERSNNVSD